MSAAHRRRPGFGDHKLYRGSARLKSTRHPLRGNIAVAATDGETRAAADGWRRGRARTRAGAVTAQAYPVATVVCGGEGHERAVGLAASTADEPARALINL